MPKSAKSDAEWHRDFIKLSRDNRQEQRGLCPPRSSKHYETYNKVVKCPRFINMHNRTRGQQLTLLFSNQYINN